MISQYDAFIGLIQLLDFEMNVNQTSNDILLKALQHQDNDYLDKIIEQNNIIISQNNIIINEIEKILQNFEK